jgi:plasmid stabilization system protein ParE
MKVLWSPGAVRDLERLREFLESKSPRSAEHAALRIGNGAAALADQPELGRLVEDLENVRDLVMHFGGGAYVLRYRIYAEAVLIARVWHSRENRL